VTKFRFFPFLIITFVVYDQLEIMHNQKHHIISKNARFTMSKHRVKLTRVTANSSKSINQSINQLIFRVA